MLAENRRWKTGDRRRSAFRHLPGRAGPGQEQTFNLLAESGRTTPPDEAERGQPRCPRCVCD
jgi:hypothetical protein